MAKMTEVASKRPYANNISQSHRDVTDDRYRDLRRPRKVKFYCNGDRYFKGKRLFITPHRYLTFNDLLNDLTGKLPAAIPLPYGVRNLYTPVGGRKVKDIDELQDGGQYVCGGFETFKPITYGKHEVEPWLADLGGSKHIREFLDLDTDIDLDEAFDFVSVDSYDRNDSLGSCEEEDDEEGKQNKNEPESLYGGYQYPGSNFGGSNNPYGRGYAGGFQPSRSLRNTYPKRGGYGGYPGPSRVSGAYGNEAAGSTYMKPKVVTVIRNGPTPRNNVKILLNRKSVHSYEQLVKDISEAFGPKWKNNKVRRLFSIRGREAQGVSDFFRDDDVFIAVGNDSLTTGDVHEIIEELYPDSPHAKALIKEWEKTKKKQQNNRLKAEQHQTEGQHLKDNEASKIDSGLGSDESARDEGEVTEQPVKTKEKKKKKKPYDMQDEDLITRLERERVKYAELERERARKRMQKRLDAEQRALNEERRKRGMVPIKPVTDPFKKMQDDREKEKRDAAEQEKARREDEERERQKEREREVKAAKARAKKAAAAEEDVPKVIVVVKGDKDEGYNRSRPVKDRVVDSKSRSPSPEKKKDVKSSAKKGLKEVKEVKEVEIEEEKKEEEVAESQQQQPPQEEVKNVKDTENEAEGVKDTVSVVDNSDNKAEEVVKEKSETDINANQIPEEVDSKTKNENNNKPAEPTSSAKPKEQNKQEPAFPEHDSIFEKKSKKQKSKIIRKSKIERQISNLDYVLNKYEPGRVLGDGNFAIVKTCTLKSSPQEYAMKIVDKSKLKGKEHMIENEIEIMKQCTHTNIVKLMEEFETHSEIYLIMELVKIRNIKSRFLMPDKNKSWMVKNLNATHLGFSPFQTGLYQGGDLFDAITQSVKFDEKTSAGMVNDLVQALYYLHSRSIVHRDLKPENLLVLRNKDGSISIKLADFGLAMDVKEPIYTVCGTPTYVAPEILSEIGYGLEVDMWATGVITYILLCGFPPFRSPDRNQTELFEFIKAGEYEFLSPYWDKTSRAAKDLISRLLIVEKRKRYTSVDVLCHPWIITTGGTKAPSENIDTYRKNLRTELDSQAKLNKESYVAAKKALRVEKAS